MKKIDKTKIMKKIVRMIMTINEFNDKFIMNDLIFYVVFSSPF